MEVLFIEPYLSGSHAQFLETLTEHSTHNWYPITLPGRHWQARMATGAAFFANDAQFQKTLSRKFDLVVCTSFLNWVEFAGFRPDIGQLPSVYYFHENQLAYMKDGVHSRLDWKFGFSQLLSALRADLVCFNSQHNMETFLSRARRFLRRFDDGANPKWADAVREKSKVVGYPVQFVGPNEGSLTKSQDVGNSKGPVILWNHRWEADKNPAEFFTALRNLAAAGIKCRLIVCGGDNQSADIGRVFNEAYQDLSHGETVQILFWGFAPSKNEYNQLVAQADIVVSTAWQEFFGVSIMEAVAAGATPILPGRLVYPELYAKRFLYNQVDDLFEILKGYCQDYMAGRALPKVQPETWQVHRASNWSLNFDALLNNLLTG